MKWLLASALLVIAGCGHVSAPPQPTAPTLTWLSNGNPNVPPCSATVTTNCLQSYTLTDIATGQQYAVSILATQYTPSGTIVIGTHTYQLQVNGADYAGKTISSPPATTSVTVQ